MSFLIDILVCLFIFITIYINSKKGLIEVAYKIVAFFIAIIISLILFKPISALLINNTNIDEYVNNYVVYSRNAFFHKNTRSSKKTFFGSAFAEKHL